MVVQKLNKWWFQFWDGDRVKYYELTVFRLDSVDGGKKIVPIRPIACLSGGMDLDDTATVRLVWVSKSE